MSHLKIDLLVLICVKNDAKEKKKEKEKKEKIGFCLSKLPFFDDRKNCKHNGEIKISSKRYGSYGDSSYPHETKNLIFYWFWLLGGKFNTGKKQGLLLLILAI